MRRMTIFAALAMALAASGCQSDRNPFDPDKPIDKMNKEEWCAYYTFYLTNPNLSAESRASALKQMQNRNCPGHA